MAAKKEAQVETLPSELTCPLCAKLFRDAVKLPCCQNYFCDDCLRGALLEQIDEKGSATCPICDTAQTPDAIQEDHGKRRAVEMYNAKLLGEDVKKSNKDEHRKMPAAQWGEPSKEEPLPAFKAESKDATHGIPFLFADEKCSRAQ